VTGKTVREFNGRPKDPVAKPWGFGAYNRQIFAGLRGQQSLRHRSSKPFAENYFHAFKGPLQVSRYRELALGNQPPAEVARWRARQVNRTARVRVKGGSTALVHKTL
jgi:hypothetical protein